MQLIEREEFLAQLQLEFDKVNLGEGRCVFVTGEAGLGKTSLVKTFWALITSDMSEYAA